MCIRRYYDDRSNPLGDYMQGITTHKNLSNFAGARNPHDDELDLMSSYISFEAFKEMFSFFCCHSNFCVGKSGEFSNHTFQCEFHQSSSFFYIAIERSSIGASFDGIKYIIKYNMRVPHFSRQVCSESCSVF